MRGLHAVSPLATLERGYAIVEDAGTGKVLTRAGDAQVGSDVRARLAEGEIVSDGDTHRGRVDSESWQPSICLLCVHVGSQSRAADPPGRGA